MARLLFILGITSFRFKKKLVIKTTDMKKLTVWPSITEAIKAKNDSTKPNIKFLGKTFLNNFELFFLSKVLLTTGAIHIAKKNI